MEGAAWASLILLSVVACGSEEDAAEAPPARAAASEALFAAPAPEDEQLPAGFAAGGVGAPPEIAARADATTPYLGAVIGGFEGPESVMYDPEFDVWYVSAFTGPSGERDADGRVSLLAGETLEILDLEWGTGTAAAPFHSGRGMTLQGDTLWVADVDGIHGFRRGSGEHLAFVDLSANEPGFLNDLASRPTGELWVTDTGRRSLIQVRPDTGLELDLDARMGAPNGILWSYGERFYIAPWSGTDTLRAWDPDADALSPAGVSPGATRVDGLVPWGGRILGGAQADSAIHWFDPATGEGSRWLPLAGRPADMGLDSNRGRLAVPFVALNEVHIWVLPQPR